MAGVECLKLKKGILLFYEYSRQDAKVLILKKVFFATLREDKYQEDMQNSRGTYALVMTSDSEQQVVIGKLGRLRVRPGYYVYVGSAFGPGGLKARIAHHTRIAVRPHCTLIICARLYV